jgi:hypothetical protein
VVHLAYRIGGARRRRDLEALAVAANAALAAGQIGQHEVVLLDAVRSERKDEWEANHRRWSRDYGPSRPRSRPLSSVPLVRHPVRDAERRLHRRDIQGLGLVPPAVRRELTPGQEAVATIYGEDHMAAGQCDFAKKAIAARAGVCERVVLRAQDALAASGKIKITRRPVRAGRHQSTIVEIIDPEWRLWLNKRLLARRVGDRRVCQTVLG